MPSHRHRPSVRSRARRRSRPIAVAGAQYHVWLAPPDSEPLIIADIGDAIGLTFSLFNTEMRDAALIMLDSRRHVVAIVLDPPAEAGCPVRWIRQVDAGDEFAGFEFAQAIIVVVKDDIADGPATTVEALVYEAMRADSLAQDVLLLDMILATPDKIRSLAFALDPDCVWMERFEPFPDAS